MRRLGHSGGKHAVAALEAPRKEPPIAAYCCRLLPLAACGHSFSVARRVGANGHRRSRGVARPSATAIGGRAGGCWRRPRPPPSGRPDALRCPAAQCRARSAAAALAARRARALCADTRPTAQCAARSARFATRLHRSRCSARCWAAQRKGLRPAQANQQIGQPLAILPCPADMLFIRPAGPSGWRQSGEALSQTWLAPEGA